MQCPKCGETFIDLQNHLRQSKKSCIGIWHVCKRCGRFFDALSSLYRHQAPKTLCEIPESGAPLQPDIPKEIGARWTVLLGTIGPIDLQRVAKRGCKQELTVVLEACSLADLQALLEIIQRLNPPKLFAILAIMSDFAHLPTVSLEKRATILEFVEKNVTL